MSVKALSDYTIYAKYARYLPEKKRRETWNEQVTRVFDMHRRKYADSLSSNPEFRAEFDFAESQVRKKRVLGSQRSLQFGGPEIEKHNAKIYNCSYGYIDRTEAFNELMYLLLCGVGVGFSVQSHHVEKLPDISIRQGDVVDYIIEDSIEGWADAIGILLNSYFVGDSDQFPGFSGKRINFIYDEIRPEGSKISGGFKAPGPEGLKNSISKIESVIERQLLDMQNRLRPIDVYDIIMHMSDAVLSGGVRRSATICLFSLEDEEMLNAKTGNWFETDPQRGRSNNSVVLVKDEVTREQFAKVMESTKQFGEPGFVWVDDKDIGYNPCVEIGLYPVTRAGESGFQFCNLTEICGKFCTDEESFIQACRASAIIGTLQAGYTHFRYVSKATKEITEYEALLGCSITGMMDNPDVLFNPEYQKKGAKEILRVNEQVAKWIGIRPAARTTCVKPAGTTSCVLGTASGVHPHHARRYIRRVQANRNEFPVQHFETINPIAVEESVWSNNNTDKVISFLCEVPSGAITKNQLDATELLERVVSTQKNWVEYGTRKGSSRNPVTRHNVSNTITVKQDEWDDVENFIYKNRKWIAGISLLSYLGDKDYAQAPFTTILTQNEIVKEYGEGSILASGVVVDGIHAFGDLWKACDTVLGKGEDIKPLTKEESVTKLYHGAVLTDGTVLKRDWLRRAIQFADRYFAGDVLRMTYCLKDCANWKLWLDLNREYKEIDWNNVVEEQVYEQEIATMGAQACAGGKCELPDLQKR